jgi:predicted metal-dependent hydrolase
MKPLTSQQGTIIISDREYPYILRKSAKAKRVSLRVDGKGNIRATVPRWASFASAHRMVAEHRAWLAKVLLTQAQRQAEVPQRPPVSPAQEKTYRRHVRSYATQQARQLAETIGKQITAIRIMQASTRWGSCNSREQRLSFNWRLALAPQAVFNYVIAHEVAHLQEANHSKKFWSLVKKIDPNFAASRRWLKRYGHTLL